MLVGRFVLVHVPWEGVKPNLKAEDCRAGARSASVVNMRSKSASRRMLSTGRRIKFGMQSNIGTGGARIDSRSYTSPVEKKSQMKMAQKVPKTWPLHIAVAPATMSSIRGKSKILVDLRHQNSPRFRII